MKLPERKELRKTAVVLLGSSVIAAGFSLVGRSAFRSDVLMVLAGYLGFIIGYKFIWYGTRERLPREVSTEHIYSHIKKEKLNYTLVLAGTLASSLGTVYFASAVEGFELVTTASGGSLVFGGYMISHEGVNNVLV